MLRCSDQSLYTGIAIDLPARVDKHNAGKASKYTRSRLPVKLVWSEQVKSETIARQREAEIKKLKKVEKEKLVKSK